MKCHVTSDKNHDILISKIIISKSFKETCSGEKKSLKIGFIYYPGFFEVKNNTMLASPKQSFIFGKESYISHDWEVLSKFFSIHNIEPSWLDCQRVAGIYDQDLGGWTGCVGKV